MKLKRLSLIFLLVLLTLNLPFITCKNKGDDSAKDTGSLVLTISQEMSKTLEPDINMDIAYYDVHGTGPDSASFDRLGITGTTVVERSLFPGIWNISVDARNSDGYIIGNGTTTVEIIIYDIAEASVIVRPLTGPGTLRISLMWPQDTVLAPQINATLTPSGDTGVPISFIIDENSASYEDTAIEAGYYSLVIQLLDGDTIVWGAFEAVRIVAGVTTEGSYSLTSDDINPAVGGINLTIIPDMQNPVSVTLEGQQECVNVGDDMSINADTSEIVDSYQWYLNGTPLTDKDTSAIIIGDELATGRYRLDLGVTRGSVISSGNCSFAVLDGDCITCIDDDGDGYGEGPSCMGPDCDDMNPGIYPGAIEFCDGIDNNCNGIADEENSNGCTPFYSDIDDDGWGNSGDSACLCDPDGQYTTSMPGDCDDLNPESSPGNMEFCDGMDNNCDGEIDEPESEGCMPLYADNDDDGSGSMDEFMCLCEPMPPFISFDGNDCDDFNPEINPYMEEVCDAMDNDCDGEIDEYAMDCTEFFVDWDEDGFGDPSESMCLCEPMPPFTAFSPDDCDEGNPDINPGAPEICDGMDNNCDDVIDDGCECMEGDTMPCDTGMPGICSAGISECMEGIWMDCMEMNPPEPEICADTLDNDCDGFTDNEDSDCP